MGKVNMMCQLEWPLQSGKEVGKRNSESLVEACYQKDVSSDCQHLLSQDDLHAGLQDKIQ